jgi:hypothetical protein
MVDNGNVTGIDPSSWQTMILPLPKRFSRGTALGFCGGHPVGRAETARARSYGCWWPAGQPELLVLEGYKDVETGRAVGDAIPGQWRKAPTGAMGAVVWALHGERLLGTDLHDRSFERTWATGAAGGVVIGVGSPPSKPGQRARDVGLVWREGQRVAVVTGAGDVGLFATDGSRLAGSLDGRATLWPSATAAPIDLAPEGMPLSEVEALDGAWQIGNAWKGMRARAGLWRGTAAAFCDLTPKGFDTARAYGGVRGFQVGFVRGKDTTGNGSAGCDNRAVLWQGAADRWFDLNALLPTKNYNASVAWAIEIRGDEVRVCGEASRYEVSEPGTSRESHSVPVAHPVLWTARLGGR